MLPERRGREGCGGGGVLIIIHGRSPMKINSRIPTMLGRNTSGFHRQGRQGMHQARSTVRCWASRMQDELHPTTNQVYEVVPLVYG